MAIFIFSLFDFCLYTSPMFQRKLKKFYQRLEKELFCLATTYKHVFFTRKYHTTNDLYKNSMSMYTRERIYIRRKFIRTPFGRNNMLRQYQYMRALISKVLKIIPTCPKYSLLFRKFCNFKGIYFSIFAIHSRYGKTTRLCTL